MNITAVAGVPIVNLHWLPSAPQIGGIDPFGGPDLHRTTHAARGPGQRFSHKPPSPSLPTPEEVRTPLHALEHLHLHSLFGDSK